MGRPNTPNTPNTPNESQNPAPDILDAVWEYDRETGQVTATLDGHVAVIAEVYGVNDYPCLGDDPEACDRCAADQATIGALIQGAPRLLLAAEGLLLAHQEGRPLTFALSRLREAAGRAREVAP